MFTHVLSQPVAAEAQTPSMQAWSLTVWLSMQVHVYEGQSAKLAQVEPLEPLELLALLEPLEPLEPLVPLEDPLVRGFSTLAVPDHLVPKPMHAAGHPAFAVWHAWSMQRCALTSEPLAQSQ